MWGGARRARARAPRWVAANRVGRSLRLGPGMPPLDYVLVGVGLVAGYLALGWAFPGLLRPLWWVLVRVLYRFSVYGREHIPATGGCLIVCNHVSLIDRLVLRAACPRTVTF